MSDSTFGLDLQEAERQMDEETDDDDEGRIVLGVLSAATADDAWVESVEAGNVLVLAIEGDLNELAAGFAREVKEMGGNLVHFRQFLIVSPPGTRIDTDRL